MNTEILLSLEMIFLVKERKAQKKTEHKKQKKNTQNHGYKTKEVGSIIKNKIIIISSYQCC